MRRCVRFIACMAIILVFSFTAAWAEEAPNPVKTYQKKTEIISQDPVELHIGVIQEDLIGNHSLEIAFLHKYPRGKIVYHLLTMDQLTAYLLSQESTIDLFILTSAMIRDYARLGALKDFYETSLLERWPEAWIDMQHQAETDGKLYGLPMKHEQSFWGWYDDLAQKLGIEKPSQPWTWDQYLNLCQTLPYDLNGDGSNDFFLMTGSAHNNLHLAFENDFLTQYAYQYALTGGSFQTPEFERLMQLFIDIYSSGALLEIGGRSPVFEDEEALLMTRFYPGSQISNIDGKHSFLLPPTIDTIDPGYVAFVYMYSLPQNAPHEELALEF